MKDLPLILRLARRELRGGLGGFRIFIACLGLGVAAIAGVGSVSESIVAGLRADSRVLLGGEVELRLQHRPAGEDHLAYLREASEALSEVIEMRAMARLADGDARSLVELKAVDAPYPLVGAVTLDPDLSLGEALARDGDRWGAAVDANLLERLGVGQGTRLRIGEAEFEVRATILREPDKVAGVFSFGPRVLIDSAALPDTELVQPGSLIRYYYRLGLAPGTDIGLWTKALKAQFPDAGWRIRTIDNAAPGVRRFVDRMTLFLTFVGLTTLLVGGIGVSNAVRSYLDSRTATIATLKCLGASGGLVFKIYLLQVLGLATLGIVPGLVLGTAMPPLAAMALEEILPVSPRIGVYPAPLLTATVFGLLTALTFALWPLARAREVPAANLFRSLVAPSDARPRRAYQAATAAGAAILALLTVLTFDERGFAYWFVAGALVTFALLRLGAAFVIRLAARLTPPRGAEWRLALANLHRPGATTASVVVSLGLGLSVLVAVVLIESNLSRQVNDRLPERAPALFFLDIQPHQVADFDATVTGIPRTSDLKRVPTLRGRIVKIDGQPVDKVKVKPDSAWAIRGDRALTYAALPTGDSEIVAGEWWPADYSGPPVISFDAELARGFGVGIGDTLTLNVLGRDIEAEIVNLREIDWQSLRFDFAIIFAPGSLEGAPQTHIAAVRAPDGAEAAVEKAVTERFSNISTIRVSDALDAAARILAGIGAAVRGTAAITIGAGALVLAGAVAAGRSRRVYDAVVFKVLGATRKRVLTAFLLEYGILGASTGLVAAVIGSVTAWAVVVHVMESEWRFAPGAVAATVLICVAITLVIGFAGTWRALGQKAAPYLRNE